MLVQKNSLKKYINKNKDSDTHLATVIEEVIKDKFKVARDYYAQNNPNFDEE